MPGWELGVHELCAGYGIRFRIPISRRKGNRRRTGISPVITETVQSQDSGTEASCDSALCRKQLYRISYKYLGVISHERNAGAGAAGAGGI